VQRSDQPQVPVRVVYLAGSLRHGGTEHYLLQLLGDLDRKRYDPIVAVFDPTGPLQKQVEALGVPTRHIPLSGKLFDRVGRGELWRFAKWLRAERVELVHGLLDRSVIWGSVAGKLARCRAVVASHRCEELEDAGAALRWIYYRTLSRLVDGVLVNAEPLGPFLRSRGVPTSKIRVIPNGIAFDGRLSQPERQSGAVTLLLVGRLSVVKGHRFLLKAFARLSEKHSGIRLNLVGDGEERPNLEALVKRLELGSNVVFSGYSDDPYAPALDANIGVLTSLSEGFPNVVLEYMAAGRAVVATSVGGVPGVVRDGVDGLLVAPASVDELTTALDRLICDPKLRASMGEAGRARAESEFGLSKMIERTQEYYDEQLGPSR